VINAIERLGAGISRLFSAARQLLVLLAIVGLAYSGAARAQSNQGAISWYSPAGPGGAFTSADAACRAQWQYYGMNNGFSRFIGAVVEGDDWTKPACKWTRYQYLCPQETGGGLVQCWTVGPSFAFASCSAGLTPTVDGHCRLNPQPECPICSKGSQGSPSSPDPASPNPNPATSNPIVLATGAKALDAQDFATADGEFRIGRHYRSFQVGRPISGTMLPRSTPRWLAGGWNFDFGYEIQLGTFSGSPGSPTAEVAILAPDGTGYGFILQPSGQWLPDPTVGAANVPKNVTLQFVGTLPTNLADLNSTQSTWQLTDSDDNVWIFQTNVGPNGGTYDWGWPTQKTARSGYQWNFVYNTDSSLASITDSFGRAATFTWNQFFTTSIVPAPAGVMPYPVAVASIGLPDGTSLNYTYDPPPATSAPSIAKIKRLVKVQRLSSANAILDSTTYLYEDTRFPTHITGVIDNLGIRIRTYAYDVQGRAISSSLASGANPYQVQFGQSGTANTSRVLNGLGKAEDYTFTAFSTSNPADYRLTQIAGESSANTGADTNSMTYGTNSFVASLTDPNGIVTTTTRDSNGRPITIVEGSGTASQRTTTITWNSTFNEPDSVVRPGLTETYTYNATGQILTKTQTDTTSQTVPYSTNGQTRTWTYTWNTSGRLLSLNGPLPPDASGHDDVTTYTYDTSGNLLTSTDALGHVTTFASFDANGRPATMTDANGIVTAYTYDPLGRVASITVQYPGNSALNAVTTIGYDAVGQVTALTLPSTDTLNMAYDGVGRVISMSAASGEQWNFAYDAMGNVASEVVKRTDGSTARQITRAFDELGRVISETTSTGHTSHWTYDLAGNPVSATSPNGNATTTAFDALNRVVTTVAPDSGTTSLGYDARDNVLSHTDPITVTTNFVYDGFGGVIQEVSPDRGTNTYWYNAAGQMTKSSDGRGQAIDYTLDILGRVTSKAPEGLPTSQTIQYVWDTGGLSGSYAVGRLAQIVDGSGTTQFQYDPRGNLLARQQSIGTTAAAQILYAYDPANRITQITYPSGRIVQYGYDSKGRVNLVQTKASSGVSSWTTVASGYTYEPFGAVDGMTLGNGLAVANNWGSEGRLVARSLYSPTNAAYLSNLSYRYDADGNIAAIDDLVTPANSIIYGYDKVDRLNLAVTSGGSPGSQSYTYTSGTNQLASLTDATGTRSVSYDGRGNTATETRPGSIAATTGYDGYGRLTGYTRTDVGAYTFTYNGLDDRVTMQNSAGTRAFVYGPEGRVLGEYGLSASDVKAEYIWALPSIGTGPFGGDDGVGGYAPLAVATPNSSGTIQLNWVFGNHLGVPLVTTDATGNLATTPNDYYAPGFPGQSRIIADLYYNRYRDYDPTTGRYIQADPIGLNGGSNPYAYASDNTMIGIDPLGLSPAGAAVGGIIGGWVGGVLGGAAGEAIGPEGVPIGAAGGRAAGRAIGQAIGEACTSQPDRLHPNKCKPYYDAIDQVVGWVHRKEYQQEHGQTAEWRGHNKALIGYARNLMGLVKTAIAVGCFNFNPDARRIIKKYLGEVV